MTYARQQLLWQKQVIVIGFIDTGSQIEEYHTSVAQFRHFFIANFLLSVTVKEFWQESRTVARKLRDAAAVLFGLKFADSIV